MIDEFTKNKIKNFYKPKLESSNVIMSLELNGKRKIFPCHSKDPLYLGFGESASSEKEALEKGFIKTSPNEIFVSFFPDKWDEVKDKYEDKRTEKYLNVVKNNIGLIDIKHGWDEEKLNNSTKHRLFMNTSDIEIGVNDQGVYVAQFSQRVSIDDYDVTRMYFKDYPNKRKIETANLIEEIELFFTLKGYNNAYFDCWECGRKVHWLDIEGDLNEKWNSFNEKYCGC